MNINDAFPSNYLKASDLGESQPIVTIAEVKFEAVGRNKEMKAVVYFTGKTKGLVLNKTNAKKIADLVGSDDTDEWQGGKVKLYATETEFGGETVECIRVKDAVTKNGGKPAKAKPVKAENEFGDEEQVPF